MPHAPFLRVGLGVGFFWNVQLAAGVPLLEVPYVLV